MKRVGLVVTSAVAFVLVAAVPALAGSEIPAPQGGGTAVKGAGGTAFTGANISLGVLLLAALLVVGVASLVMSRRKATASK